jgi:uncharacterized protein YigA (DUF484 family)
MAHNQTKKLRAEIKSLKKELKKLKENECKNNQCPYKTSGIDWEGLERCFSGKY